MATTAILTLSVYTSQKSFPPSTQSPVSSTKKAERPRLILDTSSASSTKSFGRGLPGLRPETLSATSPTAFNTYKNTYEYERLGTIYLPRAHHIAAPIVRVTQSLSLDSTALLAGDMEAVPADLTFCGDSPNHAATEIPYKVSTYVRSILVNGPHGIRAHPSPASVLADELNGTTTHRVPTLKRVCFRDPVSEDIVTTQYLAKHSDLRSRSTSPAVPFGTGLQMTPIVPRSSATDPTPRTREMAAPQQRRLETVHQEATAENMPKTPRAGRHSMSDEWTWTLAPLSGMRVPGSAMPDSDSEEDLAASLGETVAAAAAFQSGKFND